MSLPAAHAPVTLTCPNKSETVWCGWTASRACTDHTEFTLGLLQLARMVSPTPSLVGLVLTPTEACRAAARAVLQAWHRQAPLILDAAAKGFFEAFSRRCAADRGTRERGLCATVGTSC